MRVYRVPSALITQEKFCSPAYPTLNLAFVESWLPFFLDVGIDLWSSWIISTRWLLSPWGFVIPLCFISLKFGYFELPPLVVLIQTVQNSIDLQVNFINRSHSFCLSFPSTLRSLDWGSDIACIEPCVFDCRPRIVSNLFWSPCYTLSNLLSLNWWLSLSFENRLLGRAWERTCYGILVCWLFAWVIEGYTLFTGAVVVVVSGRDLFQYIRLIGLL